MECEARFLTGVYLIALGPWPATELRSVIVFKSLVDLLLGIHYEWTVLYNRFSNGFSLKHENSGFFGSVGQFNIMIRVHNNLMVVINRRARHFKAITYVVIQRPVEAG